jgi:GNAT superfamily N-acetyltransferase
MASDYHDDSAPSYVITTARPRDLARLPSIELAAARLLVGYAPESALSVVTSDCALEDARAKGHLWVALANDVAVGFAHVKLLEPSVAHLEELDVHPDHGRRGLGRKLVLAVCAWAAAERYEAVTLVTFRDPPWNMPFYASLGFTIVPSAETSLVLASLVLEASRRGIDPDGQVVMRRFSAVRP